jgi:propionyl-CoA carboxylase alpha chain
MGQAAVNVARSCQYEGAGTVEFLLDDCGGFYFLEMNTRLQVEHPVTELITGVDLVEQQIRIARGEKLSIEQDDLKILGHAIELRVYAEDPLNEFFPSIGTLVKYHRPEGPGIRVDSGYEEGMEVPIHYDPLISKLITNGKDRGEAIRRMIYAIDHYDIEGIETTLAFGKFSMKHEAFRRGNIDTNFIQQYFNPDEFRGIAQDERKIAASLALKAYLSDRTKLQLPKSMESSWKERRKRE